MPADRSRGGGHGREAQERSAGDGSVVGNALPVGAVSLKTERCPVVRLGEVVCNERDQHYSAYRYSPRILRLVLLCPPAATR